MINRYSSVLPNIIHDDSSSLYALQELASRSRVDNTTNNNSFNHRHHQANSAIPTYPGSPHQLDELAAASIFMIRNNTPAATATTTVASAPKNKRLMHKMVHLHDEDESNNIQPKSPVNISTGHDNDTLADGYGRDGTTDSPVYHDYAQEEDPTERIKGEYAGHSSLIAHEDETTRNLANQKLPAKLAAMLSDPDLITCITWLPHGRSWKILNRDLFSSYALPRYFGHSNHSSFVRVVNAWGFRRVVSGPDRDSYYHELFLRGKSSLYSRMKRLPNNAGVTAAAAGGGGGSGSRRRQQKVHSEKTLDFYEISKKSPLPENTWQYKPQAMNNGGVGSGGRMVVGGGHHHPGSLGAFGSHPPGMMGGMVPPGAAAMGLHHHNGSMPGAYPPMPPNVMRGGAPAVGSGGWNVPGGGGGVGGGSGGATAGMMGMNRHRPSSFDAPPGGTGGVVGFPDGIGSAVNSSSSSSNRQKSPQLLATAAASQKSSQLLATSAAPLRQAPNESPSSNSAEVQKLMNQNQLLKALLKKTQAAVSAAAAGGSGGGGGGSSSYPYAQAQQGYDERGQAGADGRNSDVRSD